MIVDRGTLAELFGLTAGRISQLVREGVLSKVSRGQYDSAACLQDYINFKLEGGQSGTRDVTEARTRLYEAQTHKTELETERTRRETIPADEHLADMLAFQRIANKALSTLDQTLPGDIAGLADPAAIAAQVRQATHRIREGVADSIEAYAGTLPDRHD